MEELTAEQQKTRAELVEKMTAHDWYYDFSDDGRTWHRGKAQRTVIEELARKLPADVVTALWEEHGKRVHGGAFCWGPPR